MNIFVMLRLDESQIVYSLEQGEGTFDGNWFTPTAKGDIQINMTYQDKTATATIKAMEIASIEITPNEIYLLPNENTTLHIEGTSTDGYTAVVSNNVQYAVSDGIGSVDENGIFTASAVPAKGIYYSKCWRKYKLCCACCDMGQARREYRAAWGTRSQQNYMIVISNKCSI